MVLKLSCKCGGRRAGFCLKVLQNHLRCFRYSSSSPANYAGCFIKITYVTDIAREVFVGRYGAEEN